MNDLLHQTYQLLKSGMQHDPLLSLAYTIVWLDPFWNTPLDDELVPSEDENDALVFALYILRECFPDMYSSVVEQIRAGASYDQLDTLICRHFQQQCIPLDRLEDIGYGIPVPAYGVNLDEFEFYEQHSDLLPVLQVFGIGPPSDSYRIDIPQCVYTAGRLIADDLETHPDERYQKISWLFQFMFSHCQNTCVSFSYEDMSEMPPLPWEKGEVFFVLEMIQEAHMILDEAQEGSELLLSHPHLLEALENNIRHIYKYMSKKKKGKRRDDDYSGINLTWPAIDGCASGEAEPST